MKSALFVDFDNVYTQLRALHPAAAERFARQPIEWIRWLIESLEIPDGHHDLAARRRLLVRRCYLNPNWYQGYRHAFLRAGFEIVDCPPVTAQGKTSTDIHMVLDIIELLQHETRYDEFIVLSADADFTPVLRKLRRYDRRTSVLAIGFPSAAYQASADLLIDERLFIEQALGLAMEPGEAGEPSRPGNGEPAPPVAVPATAQPAPPPATDTEPPAGRAATADELVQIARRIETTVLHSPVPVAAGPLASRLRHGYAPLLDSWNGQGSFKLFFRSLGLDHLEWINGSGGRIADPRRHAADLQAATDPGAEACSDDAAGQRALADAWGAHAGLLPMAREVSHLTGAPMLPPPVVRAVLDALCTDLATHPYEPTETARRVRNACAQEPGVDVSLRDVVFILRGMQLNGHVFGRGLDDAPTLAQRLFNQVLFLCQREQMVVDEATKAQIRQWIAGDLLV
jgi:NYN domain